MKKRIGKMIILALVCTVLSSFIPFGTKQAMAADANITIDGYYDDWSGLPYSWEYNWDNPYRIENYWDGTANITKEYRDELGNPYNLQIRHKMSLYSDGKNIYLHIEIASSYDGVFNGDWYQFFVDGQVASFRLTYPGGDSISKNDKKPVGTYAVEVRHADSSLSGTVAAGTSAMYTKKPDNLNNEMELKIPLATMKQQNPKINTDSINIIQFFTPNLMYRSIASAGTSTGPYIGVLLCTAIAGGTIWMKKRKKGSMI